MSAQQELNTEASMPLFNPWEEPTRHRRRPDADKGGLSIAAGRREAPSDVVNTLRRRVREWRRTNYYGGKNNISTTTRTLLQHWFMPEGHPRSNSEGESWVFRYHFCQREAIETLIYLYEVCQIKSLSQLLWEFTPDPEEADRVARGVEPAQDDWPRYAFQLATGTGKTKVMSLAIAWSYFHSLYEPNSPLTRAFLLIAPNVIVFDRLREDFAPAEGVNIFDRDPILPPGWGKDWNLPVVLQDDSDTAGGDVLYLTNIHRLYTSRESKGQRDKFEEDLVGPSVSKTQTVNTVEVLRKRIAAHPNLMVFNDEAHHVWDDENAWNETLRSLHTDSGELLAQLDFSATLRDAEGRSFRHIVCASPLGEAVDGGVVKTPVLGTAESLNPADSKDASIHWKAYLDVGYQRWRESVKEWKEHDKNPLLFIMCGNTDSADSIAKYLNTNPAFKALNGKTFNLHTNLKVKVKWRGKGKNKTQVIVPSENEISTEDLRELRRLSQQLDSPTSPYRCIVSVLMLREGWDVHNVTTIVPLRAYSAKSRILAEQTLGRGLRRMTLTAGDDSKNDETVVVVEHLKFKELYDRELAEQGVFIPTIPVSKIPKTTHSIFPDKKRKDMQQLEIILPAIGGGLIQSSQLQGLAWEEVQQAASTLSRLPVGEKIKGAVNYEERHLFTGEVVRRMKLHLSLLDFGLAGAISFFIKELEEACKVRNLQPVLADLMDRFLTTALFTEEADWDDKRFLARLNDGDVRERVRQIFAPLILHHTIKTKERIPIGQGVQLSHWKTYTASHSPSHPVVQAEKSLFNLTPCAFSLEVHFVSFADAAPDVAAFAKNAGHQALRIDYQNQNGQLALYTPDFLVRTTDGHCFVVETKGRVDTKVRRQAQAAIAWCNAASAQGVSWDYLFIPQAILQEFTSDSFAQLIAACEAPLQNLLEEQQEAQEEFTLPSLAEDSPEALDALSELIDPELLKALPQSEQNQARQAALLLEYISKQPPEDAWSFSPAFSALLGVLDSHAKTLFFSRMAPHTSKGDPSWRKPPPPKTVNSREQEQLERLGGDILQALERQRFLSPLGLIERLLYVALDWRRHKLQGMFASVCTAFRFAGARDLHARLKEVYEFRNKHVAHGGFTGSPEEARARLREWLELLCMLHKYTTEEAKKWAQGL